MTSLHAYALVVPRNKRAVLHHALLDEDALGGVWFDHAAILVPEHLHVLGHKRGLTLEGQAVPLEDHLALGRSQLEGRQLQRSIWGRTRGKLHIPTSPPKKLKAVEFWEQTLVSGRGCCDMSATYVDLHKPSLWKLIRHERLQTKATCPLSAAVAQAKHSPDTHTHTRLYQEWRDYRDSVTVGAYRR